MLDRLKEIPVKLLEFWNKYTARQRIIIISVLVTIILAIGILSFVLLRTQYTHLVTLADEKSVQELESILDTEGIAHRHKKVSTGFEIEVDQTKTTDATLLMGSNEIVGKNSSDLDWKEALGSSISTTESEKNKKYTLAFQSEIRTYLKSIEGVKEAYVSINAPEDDGTIFAENQETSVAVMIDISDDFDKTVVEGMARYLATAVGNPDTDMVTIVDMQSNLLFDGQSSDTLSGTANSTAEFQERLRAVIKNDLKQMLLKANYNEVEIGATNVQFNLDQVSSLFTEYSTPEGAEQGPYSESYEYSTEGNSGSGGIPGTDSNANDTDYMITDGTTTNNKTTLNKYKYDVNKKETTTVEAVGAMKPAESSLAIVLKTYKYYDEVQMAKNGELDNTDFETFKSENDTPTQLEVSDEVVDLIAKATGISTSNISVMSYEQPVFTPKEKSNTVYSNLMMIILAVLIVALLIFVVFKGTAPVEITELEPELSVEQLLATTKENQSLEDIEFGEMSETRRLIEKFVDENPEAVANLLRNWISDDWD
ncbi:MAG: hypothetical protein IIT46_13580 [Lachnospiraceae bacterium]|jgi:flagellar M-ring protein FliF|nr:hypothetical protein [Lachnospiraceae bacterium]MBQ5560784.1 hypothetical protein [Lachnospiraceae bacterium]MCR4801480.1 hypothetical protein [Lachnospiraceae bacterium]